MTKKLKVGKVLKAFKQLSDINIIILHFLDKAMNMESDVARGKHIAKLANGLDMANDGLRLEILGSSHITEGAKNLIVKKYIKQRNSRAVKTPMVEV